MKRLLVGVLGVAAGVVALAAVPGLAASAHADESARCLVRSIYASPRDGVVAPELADLRPQLTRPPFTTWKSFQLLTTAGKPLAPGGTLAFALPDERQGSLTYKQHLQPEGGKHRVRLHLEVKKGGTVELSTVFVLDEGGTLLAAGHRHEDGITILGISCSTDT